MARPRTTNPGNAALRARARSAVPMQGNCQGCGVRKATVRHHRHGNLTDNSDIQLLCRACHVRLDPKIRPR